MTVTPNITPEYARPTQRLIMAAAQASSPSTTPYATTQALHESPFKSIEDIPNFEPQTTADVVEENDSILPVVVRMRDDRSDSD
ncbi:hypothetical protein HKX48_006654 [Thoreauomyces humboldtii]|nr:hypothetical protein HKX48_006654 [Thoreauomyces humboldtii]